MLERDQKNEAESQLDLQCQSANDALNISMAILLVKPQPFETPKIIPTMKGTLKPSTDEGSFVGAHVFLD